MDKEDVFSMNESQDGLNATLKTIFGLRSIRNYSEKEIPKEDLNLIVKASVRAANASGRQSYSIIVVDDKQLLKKYFYNANKGLLFCVDFNRIIDTAKYLKHTYSSNNLRFFITGSTDTILAAQTAAIAAKSLSIDSLFTNSIHREELNIVYQDFNLPEILCFPLIALCLGYSSKEPKYLKGRLKGSGVVHYNKYHRLSNEELDKLIQKYDDDEKHISLTWENWKEMGFSHYLDWFYTRWSREIPKEKLQEFHLTLEKIGFIDPAYYYNK
ncbi:MAG: nitroreductase family protein [Candidatus Heimdallarchaeota archaeon]